jgi:acetyltransferase-like isoleucine patch superfamily enzyme
MIRKIRTYIKKNGFRTLWIIIDTRYGIGRLESLLCSNWFNPFATFWLNFRSFPLKQAFRFPVFVYGMPRLICLSGGMVIIGEIHCGMIALNKTRHGAPSNMSLKSEIFNAGQIIFHGRGEIGTGNKIVVAQHAKMEIGAYFKIADMCNIGCFSSISIGAQSRIAHRCQIFDSNYHYVANFARGVVPRYTRPMVIGKGCWVCNTTTINGGTVLPDFTIVASNSLVSKDYSNIPIGSMIGGTPAKLIASGFRRVENELIEKRIMQYLNEHPTEENYPISAKDMADEYSRIID